MQYITEVLTTSWYTLDTGLCDFSNHLVNSLLNLCGGEYMCLRVCALLCMQMWRSVTNVRYLPQSLCTFFLVQVVHCFSRLVGHADAGDLSSGPKACTAYFTHWAISTASATMFYFFWSYTSIKWMHLVD